MASVGTPARTRASTLGIRVNLGLCGTAASYFGAAVRFDDKIHQSGGSRPKDSPAAFFYALFTGAYFTYIRILALALYLKPEGSWGKSFRSLVRCHTSHGVIYC